MDPNMDMSGMSMTPTPTPLDASSVLFVGLINVIALVVAIVIIAAQWKVFVKAGQAGWKAIIPFYNLYIMLKIIGRPGWWLVLFFVPLINIAMTFIVALEMGKAFGRSTAFSIFLLFLLSPIGYCILAFGSATYLGLQGMSAPTPGPISPVQA